MKTTKTKWVKETPTEEGWYWIKYKNKHNKYIACPCEVVIFVKFKDSDKSPTVLVKTARNDTFIEGPNHGGPGLKYGGKLCPDIRFGAKIEETSEGGRTRAEASLR